MSWPQVALAAINVVQVVALAWIAAYAKRTTAEVARIDGELQEAVSAAKAARAAPGPRKRPHGRQKGSQRR